MKPEEAIRFYVHQALKLEHLDMHFLRMSIECGDNYVYSCKIYLGMDEEKEYIAKFEQHVKIALYGFISGKYSMELFLHRGIACNFEIEVI